MGHIDLSIIIVNHNSTSLLLDCFHSIKSHIKSLAYEVIVVDSGSYQEEVKKLNVLKEYKCVNVILKEDNIGYAKAVNIGLELSKGEYILISNPDVIYLEGSINKLISAFVSLSKCGAISPRVWWDEKQTFLLPNNELITPSYIFEKNLASRNIFIEKYFFKRWLERTLLYWKAEHPIKVDLISGSCIMTRRNIINEVGNFDEQFPLYFEDTDWFLRVKNADYKLYYIPEADIVHFYNQSAKKEKESANLKFNKSMHLFLKKHFRFGNHIFGIFNKIIESKNILEKSFSYDIGYISEPITFNIKNSNEKLLLLSSVKCMVPSAGIFLKDNIIKINQNIWERLSEGRYYVRIISLEGFNDLQRISFCKKT